jgi:hypothetical protein
MADDIFADVPSEGATLDIDKAFERLEAKGDKSSESQTGIKTDKPSQGGANTPEVKTEPFHKHPRWIQTQRELKETRDEIARLKAERTQNQPASVPDWWKKQYGDTPESLQRYQSVTQKDGELDWIKQQVLGELENRTKAEQATIQQGEEYVNTQISELQAEGQKFEKNALLKFMVDFQNEYGAGALLDAEGNYDFRKSLTLMQKLNPEPATPNVNKALASIGKGRAGSGQSQSKVPIISRNALRKGNWRDADTGQFTSR